MALIEPIFSYEQLLQLPDDGKRYEILEGELLVSPSPVPKHQRAVLNLAAFLLRAEAAGYGEVYVAPLNVVFDPHNVTEPDVLFIRRERLAIVAETNVRGAPDIVVEVLSPRACYALRVAGAVILDSCNEEDEDRWPAHPADRTRAT